MSLQPAHPKTTKTRRQRGRWRRRLVFLAWSVFATALLLALLEFIASFYTELPSSTFIRDVRLSHTWPPSTTHTHRQWLRDNPEFPEPYVHTYNRQCWIATYDVVQPKPKGTYRIFYVGDSFTEGCVPMDQSIPSRLAELLDEKFKGRGIDFEVINAGTSSYSTLLHYIQIRYFIAPYEPDAIVINVDMTDNFDDWKYKQRMITDSEGAPYAVPPVHLYGSLYVDTLEGAIEADLVSRVKLFLYERSHLFNLLLKLRKRPPKVFQRLEQVTAINEGREPAFPRWGWCHHEWDDEISAHVRFSMDTLGRIVDFCTARGIKLMLTGVPHHQQFVIDENGRPLWSVRPHREIEALAKTKGVAYLDSWKALLPKLKNTPQTAFYYRGDIHFNPHGNRVWADAHLEFFVDPAHRLLPKHIY